MQLLLHWFICNFSFNRVAKIARVELEHLARKEKCLSLSGCTGMSLYNCISWKLKINDHMRGSLFRQAHPWPTHLLVVVFPLVPTLTEAPGAQHTTSICILLAFLLRYMCTFLVTPAGAGSWSCPIHLPNYQ